MNQGEMDVDSAQIGRILHVVYSIDGRFVCRPAICYDDDFPEAGTIDVKAFLHGTNQDLEQVRPNHITKEAMTWHWPRECSKLHA